MMKAMGGGKARGPMAGLASMMGMGGGMPSPEEMAKLAEKMPGGLPPGMPGLPPTMPGCRRTCRARQIPGSRRRRRQAADAGRIAGGFLQEEMSFTDSTNATNADQSTERNSNACCHPHGPRRNQEAPGLSHRRRRQPRAARRPLHRAARLFQSAAAEGQGRAAQARPRQGEGLDRQGRAAVRPRDALPRRRRRRQAREAQQSGEGDPAQGAQGRARREARRSRTPPRPKPRPRPTPRPGSGAIAVEAAKKK